MHELSLCRAIADTVIDHAGGREVSKVAVKIGHFRQVVPSTLEFCWDIVVADTALDGCALDIDHVPAVAHCPDCGADTTLERPVMICGSCGGRAVKLTSGDEFLVASIDVKEVV